MRYCELKFVYKKASLKFTALENLNHTGKKTHLGK